MIIGGPEALDVFTEHMTHSIGDIEGQLLRRMVVLFCPGDVRSGSLGESLDLGYSEISVHFVLSWSTSLIQSGRVAL